MDLGEYLKQNGIKQDVFAQKAKIHKQTVHNVIKGQGIHLNIAYKIEKATRGEVTCQDLAEFIERVGSK